MFARERKETSGGRTTSQARPLRRDKQQQRGGDRFRHDRLTVSTQPAVSAVSAVSAAAASPLSETSCVASAVSTTICAFILCGVQERQTGPRPVVYANRFSEPFISLDVAMVLYRRVCSINHQITHSMGGDGDRVAAERATTTRTTATCRCEETPFRPTREIML